MPAAVGRLPARATEIVDQHLTVFLGLAAIALLALPFVDSEAVGTLLHYVVALLAVLVATVGVVRRPEAERGTWIFLLAGLVCFVVADLSWDAPSVQVDGRGPSVSDGLYLAGDMLLIMAFAGFVRMRRATIEDVLDALIVTIAAASVLWILVLDDVGTLDTFGLVSSTLYLVLDLVLFAMVMTALFADGRIDRVTGSLLAAILAFIAADQAWGLAVDQGTVPSSLLDVGWLVAYLLLAVASAASSTSTERRAPPDAALGWSSLRLCLLLSAAMVPLLATLLQAQGSGTVEAARAASASAVMVVLLVFRMELVIRGQRGLIGERASLLTSLQRQAVEDPLTGLANRRGLFDHLETAADRVRPGAALMVLDLDDFKAVNDSLGHPAGDALLNVVAERLRHAIRAEDVVARLGGDEFAIVAHGSSTDTHVAALADRVLASLEEPVEVAGRRIAVSASIGIATATTDEDTVESLLRDADNALYEAKDRGKARWVVFDPQMRVRALRKLSFDGELARAVAEREFELVYQPIVSLTTGRVEWVEALLRWKHPSLGMLGPSEFLQAADRSRHMPAIYRWVLEEAVSAAASWRRAGHPDVGVSINMSTGQLEDESLVETVSAVLERADVPPARLMLELLESSFETTPGLVGRMARLRALGVMLAVDDFGSGFSSLARLSDVPASVLKLDRSLVAGRRDTRMTGAIVRLGRTLGLHVIAEGVETRRELERMRGLGCDAVQGYRIARPLPARRVVAFLASWDPGTIVRSVSAAEADGREPAPAMGGAAA